MQKEELNFNLQCDLFKNNLIQVINKSNLPAAVIYYIYKDIFQEIQKNYMGILNSQILSQNKKPVEIKSTTQQVKQDKTE